MSSWNPRANDLFLNARELPAGAARSDFLESACGDDAPLRAEVEGLLAAELRSAEFLEVSALDTLRGQAPIARPGDSIGRYVLVEQLGEGGMGVVFQATQLEPVRRTVALKIIKIGMDPEQVLARFAIECQALAMMDHPNIARVFDAGQTTSGLPYFVMELVTGLPITVYCDKQHLTVRQRMSLFVPVCRAVQHAHQKGII